MRDHGRAGRALSIGGAALALAALNFWFAVHTTLGQAVERRLLDAGVFRFVPPVPLNLVSVPAVVVVLVLLCAVAWFAHGPRRSLVIGAAAGASILASQVLKDTVLDRPDLHESAPNTFPSGHMMVFTVVVAVAIFAVPRGWAWITALFGSAGTAWPAWQLLAHSWHRPSDLVGAQMIAVTLFALASLIARPSGRGERFRGGERFAGFVLVLVAIISLAAAVVSALLALRLSSDGLALNAAELVLVAVSCTTVRLMLALSR